MAEGNENIYVSKSGDTMFGVLNIGNNQRFNILMPDADASASSVPYTGNYIQFRDKNGAGFVWLGCIQDTDGTVSAVLGSRHIVSGANKDNSIELIVKSDGTKQVYLSNPEAWRNALGIN